MTKNTELGDAVDLDDVVNLLNGEIDEAVTHIASHFEPQWAQAERYYKGETDLEEFEGRSQVTKTEVRDAIRNTLPSLMRVLCQSRKIVQYSPSNIMHTDWVNQQSEYLTDFFWRNGGYELLYSSIKTAAKLKYSPIRCYYVENPVAERVSYTNAPITLLQELLKLPDVEDLDYEDTDTPGLVNITHYKTFPFGKIQFEATPVYEFFMSPHCTSIEDATRSGVHGIRREVTVTEAIELGLDYEDWRKLDTHDPETAEHGKSSSIKRGYGKKDALPEIDITRHKFLLTMVYYATDLKGTGTAQLYKFWLGGTSYKYLDHDEVDFSEFELVQLDPEPGTFGGTSIADLTIKEQDTSTSLLRAVVDNAHAANNPRPIGNPDRVNFDDLMNSAIGAPIRSRTGEPIQFASVPFTGGQLLPVLGYLDQDVQNKIGITKAAQGLDPDALQSTDKQAVMNTIMSSQGQTELMARNIVELALIPFFAKVLKLSLRHLNPIQIMRTRGTFIPVDVRMFDPDASAMPNVGLGTGELAQKQQTLGFVLQKQEMYMEKFGYDNPFTSLDRVFNTLEDMLEMGGIVDVGRYFQVVTPDTEKMLAKRQQEQQQQAKEEAADQQPVDPNRAYIAVEQGKQQIEQLKLLAEQRAKEAELAQRALEAAERADLERDRLIQNRELKLIELSAQQESDRIKREQEANNNATDTNKRTEATSSKKSA